jgi:hypothetical protein
VGPISHRNKNVMVNKIKIYVPKALNMLSILKCINYVLAIGLFRAFPSNKILPLDGIIPSNLEKRGNIFS